MSEPQAGLGGGTPSPRKLSAASAMMGPPRAMLASMPIKGKTEGGRGGTRRRRGGGGQAHDPLNRSLHKVVEPAAEVARDHAEERAPQHADAHGGEADPQRYSRTVHDPGEDVAPQAVRAE